MAGEWGSVCVCFCAPLLVKLKSSLYMHIKALLIDFSHNIAWWYLFSLFFLRATLAYIERRMAITLYLCGYTTISVKNIIYLENLWGFSQKILLKNIFLNWNKILSFWNFKHQYCSFFQIYLKQTSTNSAMLELF